MNIFGGFLVTQRMLAMYPEEEEVIADRGSAQRERTLMSANLAALLYLVAGVLFILALRGLSSPETSRRGNTVRHDRHGDRDR